jgi:hypothetical protein
MGREDSIQEQGNGMSKLDAVAVVMTEFGEYVVHPTEEAAFRKVYGNDELFAVGYFGRFKERRWERELIHYATEQMRAQWEQGK